MNLYAITALIGNGENAIPTASVFPAEDRDEAVSKAHDTLTLQGNPFKIESVLQLEGLTDNGMKELVGSHSSVGEQCIFALNNLLEVVRLQRTVAAKLEVAFHEAMSKVHALAAVLTATGLKKFTYAVLEEGTGIEHPHATYAPDRESAIETVEEFVRANYPANSLVIYFQERNLIGD